MEAIIPTQPYDSFKLNWQPLVLSVSDHRPERGRGKRAEETRERKWMEPWVHFLPRPKADRVSR